jgi:hypothetical protein
MPALLPPPTIGRCSASSRSFLLGPDGPAGAPPGQALRSGALIGQGRTRSQKQDPYYGVSTVSGEPRSLAQSELRALRLLSGFAAALGWGERDLRAYEPRPLAQAYPAYLDGLD